MENIVEYNITNAAIEKMAEMYMGLKIVDLEDKEQFDAVHSARMVVRGKRVEVDKRRKELKADALAWGKKVQTEANRIFALIEPIETHLKAEEGKAEAEKARIESERISEVQKKVDVLKCINIPETVEGLNTLIERISAMLISPSVYFEFCSEAEAIIADKLLAAKGALERRIRMDKEESEQKAEAERLEKLRAEQKADAEKLRAEQEKIDIVKREQAAAQTRIEEEKAKIEAEKQFEQERRGREEFEKQAKIQAEIDAKKKAERADSHESARAAYDRSVKDIYAAYIPADAARPDKEKLMAFAQFLESITYPEVESSEAKKVVSRARLCITDLSASVFDDAEDL